MLFSLLCLLFLTTCKKEPALDYILTGTVYDFKSGEIVSSAEVAVFQRGVNNGAYNANYSLAVKGKTDKNGHFELSWNRSSASDFKVSVGKNMYFPEDVLLQASTLHPNEAHFIQVLLSPQAVLKVSVRNDLPFNQVDQITYQNLNLKADCICCDNEAKKFVGTQTDTSWTCVTYGAVNLHYIYEVRKDTNLLRFDEVLYLTPLDTTFISIDY